MKIRLVLSAKLPIPFDNMSRLYEWRVSKHTSKKYVTPCALNLWNGLSNLNYLVQILFYSSRKIIGRVAKTLAMKRFKRRPAILEQKHTKMTFVLLLDKCGGMLPMMQRGLTLSEQPVANKL